MQSLYTRKKAPADSASPQKNALGKATRILVINGKGGCGKTTISTNISALLSAREIQNHSAIVDFDPQGSSMAWLRKRPSTLKNISGLDVSDNKSNSRFKRSWHLFLPASTSHIILDSPAGVKTLELTDILASCDVILMPVLPSAIDIRASAAFIKKIFLDRSFRRKPKPIAVIANRVRKNTEAYNKLQKFLLTLDVPMVSVFTENQAYLRAADQGCGVNELDEGSASVDQREWDQLLKWLDHNTAATSNSEQTETPPEQPVVVNSSTKTKIKTKPKKESVLSPYRRGKF